MENLNDILARVNETSMRVGTYTPKLESIRDTLAFMDGGFMRGALASMPYTGGLCRSDRKAFVSSKDIRWLADNITKLIESKNGIFKDDSLHSVVHGAIDVLNGVERTEPEVPKRQVAGHHIDPNNHRDDDFVSSIIDSMSCILKSDVDTSIQKVLSAKHQSASSVIDDEYQASPITSDQRTRIHDAINSMKG